MALILGASVLPSGSQAQVATLTDGGMDLHLFRPAVDSRGYFSVNGTEVLPHKDFSFGLVLDAGFGILRYNGFETIPTLQPTPQRARAESRSKRSPGP